MSVHVEPRDVLAYLNSMGFRNISADQLRAFIRDLKKLIKHDLKESKYPSSKSPEVSTVTSNTDISSYGSSTSCYQADKDTGESHASCISNQDEMEHPCTSTEKHEVCVQENTEESAELNSIPKPEKQKKCLKVADRPRSSFIKPWQLQATTTQRRTDPVALYHKYQSLWQQQKIPGDDARVGVRWTVREKMFGINPQPRPVPKVPSMERISRRKQGCMRDHLI